MSLALLQCIPTLFAGRRTWSPPRMRGARIWEATIADHLHAAALLEDLARRGGPRTAREYSERDWLRQALDPEILRAAEESYATHKHGDTTSPRKQVQRRARRPRLARWEVALRMHEAGAPA